jgi:hypothetical protein
MTIQEAILLIDQVPDDDPLFGAVQAARALLGSTEATRFGGDPSGPTADAGVLREIYETRQIHLVSRGFRTHGWSESIAALQECHRVILYAIKESGWSIVLATPAGTPTKLVVCLVTICP